MPTFTFPTCGLTITPKAQWLSDLLVMYQDGDITAGELFNIWFSTALKLGTGPNALVMMDAFGKKCLGLFTA